MLIVYTIPTLMYIHDRHLGFISYCNRSMLMISLPGVGPARHRHSKATTKADTYYICPYVDMHRLFFSSADVLFFKHGRLD